MIEYKGKLYHTRDLQVKFLEDNLTQDIIVTTTELQEAIGEAVDIGIDMNAVNIDSNIYFFMEPDEFFQAEITELDQPITIISEDSDHIKDSIVEQMENWNLAELFDYNIDQELLDSDEDIDDHMESRSDFLSEAQEHRGNVILPNLSLQELLDRYKSC